jgi:tetratricopeptide (TPR) repeat protein
MKLLLSFLLIIATPIALINPQMSPNSPLAGEEEHSQNTPLFLDTRLHQEEVRKHPKSPRAYYNLGKACLARPIWPDLIDARKAFKRAVELKPDYAEAYNSLGVSYQGFQFGLVIYGTFYDKAIEAHKTAIRIKPDYPEAYLGLGKAYCAVEKYEQGKEAFKRALLLKPDYDEARKYLEELKNL